MSPLGEPLLSYFSFSYYITMGIFAFIVVPIACMNVSEQAVIQMIMTGYRFTAFGIMFITLVVAIAYGSNPYVNPIPNPNNTHPNSTISPCTPRLYCLELFP